MEISRFARPFGTLAAVALLAGCGNGSGSPVGAPLNNPATLGGATMARPDNSRSWIARPDHSRSWMAPDAKKHDLLYVSDSFPYGSNDVYVYSYPKGKLKGQADGLQRAVGPVRRQSGQRLHRELRSVTDT